MKVQKQNNASNTNRCLVVRVVVEGVGKGCWSSVLTPQEVMDLNVS